MKIIKFILFFLLPFTIFGQEIKSAISVRSPKQEDKKFDFHVSFGYASKPVFVDLAYERENGGYYFSDHVWWNMNKYSRISHLGDEVRDIDIESLLLHVPVYMFNFGIDQTWNDFSDYRVLFNARMKYRFIEVNYSSNFGDREIIISKMRFEKKLNDKTKLLLLFEYKKFNDDDVWRTNVGISYEFGKNS